MDPNYPPSYDVVLEESKLDEERSDAAAGSSIYPDLSDHQAPAPASVAIDRRANMLTPYRPPQPPTQTSKQTSAIPTNSYAESSSEDDKDGSNSSGYSEDSADSEEDVPYNGGAKPEIVASNNDVAVESGWFSQMQTRVRELPGIRSIIDASDRVSIVSPKKVDWWIGSIRASAAKNGGEPDVPELICKGLPVRFWKGVKVLRSGEKTFVPPPPKGAPQTGPPVHAYGVQSATTLDEGGEDCLIVTPEVLRAAAELYRQVAYKNTKLVFFDIIVACGATLRQLVTLGVTWEDIIDRFFFNVRHMVMNPREYFDVLTLRETRLANTATSPMGVNLDMLLQTVPGLTVERLLNPPQLKGVGATSGEISQLFRVGRCNFETPVKCLVNRGLTAELFVRVPFACDVWEIILELDKSDMKRGMLFTDEHLFLLVKAHHWSLERLRSVYKFPRKRLMHLPLPMPAKWITETSKEVPPTKADEAAAAAEAGVTVGFEMTGASFASRVTPEETMPPISGRVTAAMAETFRPSAPPADEPMAPHGADSAEVRRRRRRALRRQQKQREEEDFEFQRLMAGVAAAAATAPRSSIGPQQVSRPLSPPPPSSSSSAQGGPRASRQPKRNKNGTSEKRSQVLVQQGHPTTHRSPYVPEVVVVQRAGRIPESGQVYGRGSNATSVWEGHAQLKGDAVYGPGIMGDMR